MAKRKNNELNQEGEFWKMRAIELNLRCQELLVENMVLTNALQRSRVFHPEQFESRADLH